MIKAVFFDLYNTLVRFWPPLEEIQRQACLSEGMKVTDQEIRRGYALADNYFSEENSRHPLFKRSRQELDQFFSEYERLILKGAGVGASQELALKVWRRTQEIPKRLALFDDVPPALERLRQLGLTLGGLSNLRPEMRDQMDSIGLFGLLDFVITSQEAGAQKPFPPIFRAALERAKADPHEAVHVGDQYHSDVLGALGVGIKPVLLDRRGFYGEVETCPRVRDMAGLVELLEEGSLD